MRLIHLRRGDILILAGACLISLGVYLFTSNQTYRTGFPLDDAWIHQTYARNLAEGQGWVFSSGKSSGGSTSPLWTVLLSLGHLSGLGPYVWTFSLGWFLSWATALVGEETSRQLIPGWRPRLPWVGLLLAFEWHLAWAAGSGMETLLFGLSITWVLSSLLQPRPPWCWLGIICGVSVWIRPDGITLLGPVIFCLVMSGKPIGAWWRDGAKVLTWTVVGTGLYMLFNVWVGGTVWPATLYAKQTEYAGLQSIPYLTRYAGELGVALVGVGILLLPGWIIVLIQGIKNRNWAILGVFAWWFGFLGIYAWRLPVTYQHGRYVMPLIPIFVILGAVGMLGWAREHTGQKWQRILGTSWLMACALVELGFWVMAAGSYASDVAIIETEMVEPALWLEANSAPGDRVAAHDIGALGYFSRRELLDLAGLVSPEVTPILGDEEKLAILLDEREIDYLILTFDWYPRLRAGKESIYCSQAGYAPALGAKNTCIYAWHP